ncbi:unnamed protein product [Adineta ricciae]|uniref:Uncharacterized protein n=1 Tax=Adineta ricciae TaxID=249248 RepID=A0A816DNA8_ADIRI|nr:unnamed protein product [Adineta ricciae]
MATEEEEVEQRTYEEVANTDENTSSVWENKENITLIWFDTNIQIDSPDIQLTKRKLKEINNDTLVFTDINLCIQRIESIKSKKIFLVVSGMSADTLLSKVHNLCQIDSVFIFCMKKSKYDRELIEDGNYSKIVDIFVEQSSLIRSIQKNVELAEKQMDILRFYEQNQKPTRNLTKESASFIWHQLLKEVLQKMPSGDENAKEEMLKKCRLYYRDNKKVLKDIDEFARKYSKHDAVKWYTKNRFIFKLINEALRTEDVEVLYTFRFYLIDLCSELSKNHQRILEYQQPLSLYRGTTCTKDYIQFLKDSVDHLISTNGFFSTSKQIEVAEMYADVGKNLTEKNDCESIIYKINYDPNAHPKTIVADVSGESQFPEEKEFLFDLGTVFQITEFYYNEEKKYWICEMVPSNKGLEIAKEYLAFQRDEINHEESDISIVFGNLLFKMGEHIKCRNYFQNLLSNQVDTNVLNRIEINQGLGRALTGLREFDLSRNYFQDAYALCTGNNSSLGKRAKLLGHIGFTYDRQGNFNTALDYYFKALKLVNNDAQCTNQIAYLLTKIGQTYYSLGQDDLSLKHFEKSYIYLQKSVPEDHPDMIEYYNNMCIAYYHRGLYHAALYYQWKSYEIILT